MKSITFKLDEEDARRLREAARRNRVTLSEFIRGQLLGRADARPINLVRSAETGAEIFASAPHLRPLTTEAVREMLADFP